MSLGFDQQDTFLYVKDLEKNERSYGEILGLELVLNQGLPATVCARPKSPRHSRSGRHPSLAVHSLPAVRRRPRCVPHRRLGPASETLVWGDFCQGGPAPSFGWTPKFLCSTRANPFPRPDPHGSRSPARAGAVKDSCFSATRTGPASILDGCGHDGTLAVVG
jgi:hypothetical protein